jgi:predicted O-linked N-acetylglucosamine transferase (SPINDLY family)
MAGSWFGWWRRAAPSRQGVADAATDLPRDRRDLRSWLEQGHAERLLQRLDAGGGPAEAAERAYWRGAALKRLGRLDEALHWLDEALRLSPGEAEILETRGNTWMGCGLPASARADYEAALLFDEDRDDSRYNLGLALLQLRQPLPALAVLDALLARHPDDAQVHLQRGNALLDLRRFPEARAAYRRSLDLDPRQADGWHNLGVVGQELREPDTAAEAFAQSLRLDPGQPLLPGKLLHARMQACGWRDHDVLLAQVEAGLRDRRATIEPFAFQGVASDEALQAICAELAAQAHALAGSVALPARTRPSERPTRLRVGYVCGELRQQATAFLTAQLFESHDRARFECIALDNGWDDGSPMRRRLEAAFDRWVDLSGLGDEAAARVVADLGVDILVDLNGYFGRGRPGLFAWRAAPIQVAYLGFPGTTGAPWMDYIVADRVVIPPEARRHYREQVAWLPRCYQANDVNRPRPVGELDRAAAGLPANGVVFCCFNNNYKITPVLFALWLRLLQAVPGSVLWLLQDNADAARNLRAVAQAAGVAPGRLVFAPRLPLPQHMARHALADLFLDTLPCNAHTTASDALWAGLPLLTCRGRTFSGRVAASLLGSLGLDELVCEDLVAYEQTALRLAHDPNALAAMRKSLCRRVSVSKQALFDGAQLCQDLEALYDRMWEHWQQGLPPAPIESVWTDPPDVGAGDRPSSSVTCG